MEGGVRVVLLGGIRDANIPVSLGSSPGVQMNYADPVQTECVEVLA